MNLTTTRGASVSALKLVVHGQAGSGKTTLAGTTGDLPGTLLIDIEAGALPLRGMDIARAECSHVDDLHDAYREAASGRYSWVIIDSLSEAAEVILADELTKAADPRQAYGATQERIAKMVRLYRALPCHVVFCCKQDRIQTSQGLIFGPLLPGKQLSKHLPYWVDCVLSLRVGTNDAGAPIRWLQSQPDGTYDAKDRSGSLPPTLAPDLSLVARLVAGPATEETDR